MKIILASASPRRAEVLRDAGIGFTALATKTDESRLPGEAVAEMVRRLAEAKAGAAAKIVNGLAAGARAKAAEAAIIIGADTTVEIEGEALGKPGSAEAARAMLERLSGKTHRVHTGVAMLRLPDGAARIEVEQTEVHFANMTATEIETYVATGEPFDKAGGYGVQGFGGRFVERIEGCYFNVVGLPLARVYRMLRELGWQPERN
jgi:septum formation protein